MQQYHFAYYQRAILQHIADLKVESGICTTPTTTLIVSTPIDVRRLEARYKLIRYELPHKLHRLTKRNRHAYGQMQNSLRDQLDCPYKTFKYDRLDEAEKWVVYALYPRHAAPITLQMPFLSDAPLLASEIALDQLDAHLLLQLLQVAYCRSEQSGRFVGQDQCYVHAKKDGNNVYVCLQIDIQSDLTNTQLEENEQEFKVVAQARRLQRVISPKMHPHSSPYFVRKENRSKSNFCYLKKSEVEAYWYRKEPLYKMCAREEVYTTLLHQDQHHIEEYIGKLLNDFIRDFSMHLANYGIICRSKERQFTRFIPPNQHQLQLPLSLLNPIAVFDNRLSRTYPLQEYLDVLAHLAPTLLFNVVADLSEVHTGGILIIQDYTQEDFELHGIFKGQADPSLELYKQYPHIPKQSINVNSNTSADKTAHTYLDYSIPNMEHQDFKRKVDIALAQLYLQDVIYYQRSVQERLPLMPGGLVFIRKKRYHAEQPPYETLLYIENDMLYFLNLCDSAQLLLRDDLLARLGIDWRAMYDLMRDKYCIASGYNDEQELSHYDVIVGPDLFVELEDLNERVLYDYDEIVRSQTSTNVTLPIEELKLLPHYDIVCTTDCLPLSSLVHRGLLEKHALPKNRREEASLKFYRQLEEYDAFLNDVQCLYPALSFNALTQDQYWEEIVRIFNIQPDKNGHYSRSQFKGYYQKRGWFSSDKEKELPMYEGIWYDDTLSYMVGLAQPPDQQQPRAHIIRRFHVYQGADHFDMSPLLLAASVQAINLDHYQAYPYPFHLIDLHIEDRTNHSRR